MNMLEMVLDRIIFIAGIKGLWIDYVILFSSVIFCTPLPSPDYVIYLQNWFEILVIWGKVTWGMYKKVDLSAL